MSVETWLGTFLNSAGGLEFLDDLLDAVGLEADGDAADGDFLDKGLGRPGRGTLFAQEQAGGA